MPWGPFAPAKSFGTGKTLLGKAFRIFIEN